MAHVGLPALAAGSLFRGRYRIVRLIKAGGQGAVYEVKDETTNRPRALKVMLPSLVDDADMRARFELEARVTGDIESDHLVRISDVGIDEASGAPFMLMDLLRGEDLQSTLTKRGALPPAEALDYLAQTARVLDKTHAANIVHRDLKPDNLFVTARDDGSPCIKILDFGIAKVIAQANAKKTRALGTPLYMAPEQVRGDPLIGLRVDVLALAHVAYTLLTGSAYWLEDAQSDPSLAGLIMKIMGGVQESPTTRALRRSGVRLPEAFDAWFRRATAVLPEERFESAGALVAALGPILATMTAGPSAAAQMGQQTTHLAQQAAMTNLAAASTGYAPTGQAWPSPTQAVPQGYVPTGQTWAGPTQAAPAGQAPPGPTNAPYANPLATGQVYPGQPYPQPGYGAPNPMPTQGYAPHPVPAAPAPASTPLVPILAAVGGIGLLVVILLVVLVFRSGSSGSSGPVAALGPAAAADCGAAAACAPTQTDDPKHTDALEQLAAAKKLAKQVDSSAQLMSISAQHAQRDGTTDLTTKRFISYLFFTSKNEVVSVLVNEKSTQAFLNAATPNLTPAIADPRCTAKQAMDAAVGQGVKANPTVSMFYSHDPGVDAPRWMVYDAAGTIVHVDAKTCK